MTVEMYVQMISCVPYDNSTENTSAIGVFPNTLKTPQALKASSKPKMVMISLESNIADYWSASAKVIQECYGLEVPLGPTDIAISPESGVLRIGGHFNAKIRELKISEKVASGRLSLKGVVFRESFIAALPNDLCTEAQRDFGTEYARQYLNKNEQSRWIELWKAIPSRRMRSNLEYNSFKLMKWISALGGRRHFGLLIHELVAMARYGHVLDFEEYIEYMARRSQDIQVSLGHAEVKILDILLRNQEASNDVLASLTGLSSSWISTQINRLKRKCVLIGLTTTPFSRIGIRSFHVLLSGIPSLDPSRFLNKCPFLYSIRHILNGPWQVMARLAVPDNYDNIKSLKLMAKRLNDIDVTVDIGETHSAGHSFSFYHYDVANHQWAIPWVAMLGWGQRIERESLDKVIEQIDTPSLTTNEYIDNTDIMILSYIHENVSSTRALRKRLGIGQNQLSRRMKRLRSAGLIRSVWDAHNIGLVERVALRATDSRISSMLDAWSREIPHVVLQYGKRRDLTMLIDLPIGGSTKMMDTIRKLGWNVVASPLGSGIWGQWRFPEHLWSEERQRWLSPDREIDIWIDSLEEECEAPTRKTAKSALATVPVVKRRG
ncbi:MAG: ArsR family transcriptional regulator [Candidatus Thorarchaeota archaeon]|nr:ArsR family transcriptional regulator [Candidatus Thorarchaeota archaeon]